MALPDWLKGCPEGVMLEALHAVAWSDGDLDPMERDLLIRLLKELGLSPEPAALSLWVDTPPQASESPAEHDPFTQRFLISRAIQMAFSDGDYSSQERAYIASWAAAWSIDTAELDELEAETIAEARSEAAESF